MGEEKILTGEQAAVRARNAKRQGQTVVFTNGCFDLLTPGHCQILQEARALGGLVIVGLNSDRSVRGLKGPDRPIYAETDRAFLLSCLESVDVVTLFEDPTPMELIRALKPDVLVKGSEYADDRIVGAEEVAGWGGRVHRARMRPGISTSKVIERIRDAAARESRESTDGSR